MVPMNERVRSFVAREEGATMVEYGLMILLLAIACLTAIDYLGIRVSSIFYRLFFIFTTGRDPKF